jgi:hypothetical protein
MPVMDMVIHPRDQSLVMATHGRGIMIIDDLTPFRQLSGDILENDVTFLTTKDYIITEGSYRQEWAGDDEFTGTVPSEAATIAYYLKKRHVFGDMNIEIYDKDNKLIQKLPAGKRKGINLVYWNIRMKPPKVPASPQMEGSAMSGPTVSPGEYTVKLYIDKDMFEAKIRLLYDPKSRYSVKDREIRQNAVMQAYHLLESLAYIDRQATDIRDMAKDRSKGTSKILSKELNDIAIRMDTMHSKLVATKEGKVTGEERIREKLAFIYGSIISFQGKPTESQLTGLKDFTKEVDKLNSDLKTFYEQDLAKVNQQLVELKKEEIRVISQEEFMKEQ